MAYYSFQGNPVPSFRSLESECELHFKNIGPCWHICTPGENTEVIFTCDEDYAFGITAMALCAAELDLIIIAFELMSNHYHIIAVGSRKDCLALSNNYNRRIKRYFVDKCRPLSLSGFVCTNPIEITTLEMMRNEICYTNRNGYAVNPSFTPFTYPWGCGKLYFTDFDRYIPSQSISEISVRQQRNMFHTKSLNLPQSYRVRDGMIIQSSFCRISEGERFFRNAHHYFQMIAKNLEAFSESAARLGDKVFVTDSEMYSVAAGLCHKTYGYDSLIMLSGRQRIEIARTLRFKYKASIKQIKRILKLDDTILQELFPGDISNNLSNRTE